MFQTIAGRTYNVATFGVGPTTLLGIVGWLGTWQLWRLPFELLSTRCRCIAYDGRGAGQTQARQQDLVLEGFVDDIFAVLDANDIERCWLLGEAMGSLFAMLAALRDPSRFDGLALVCSRARWAPSGGREHFLTALDADYEKAMSGFVQACMPAAENRHLRRWLLNMLLEADRSMAAPLIRMCYGVDVTHRIGVIPLPALVVHGDADAIVPTAEGELVARSLPHSELMILPGGDHLPTLTRPFEVAKAILDFVERHARG